MLSPATSSSSDLSSNSTGLDVLAPTTPSTGAGVVESSMADMKSSVYASDEFRIYSFKVRPCSRAYSHDWTECPFVHPGENARRRDPRKFHYSCVPCPDFRKGSCRRGDSCEYAHGVFECWLHPAQYRTRLCKDGTSCSRRVCFFAHTSEELRPLQSPAAGTPASMFAHSPADMRAVTASADLPPPSPSSVRMMSQFAPHSATSSSPTAPISPSIATFSASGKCMPGGARVTADLGDLSLTRQGRSPGVPFHQLQDAPSRYEPTQNSLGNDLSLGRNPGRSPGVSYQLQDAPSPGLSRGAQQLYSPLRPDVLSGDMGSVGGGVAGMGSGGMGMGSGGMGMGSGGMGMGSGGMGMGSTGMGIGGGGMGIASVSAGGQMGGNSVPSSPGRLGMTLSGEGSRLGPVSGSSSPSLSAPRTYAGAGSDAAPRSYGGVGSDGGMGGADGGMFGALPSPSQSPRYGAAGPSGMFRGGSSVHSVPTYEPRMLPPQGELPSHQGTSLSKGAGGQLISGTGREEVQETDVGWVGSLVRDAGSGAGF
ncbi:unnamed protein product [Closterium sp. NIES-65]|nr:unnamed protein product [Closterium sp. NIES-65]